MFRIAQEAFANIRKHASTATHVSVALIYEPDRVQLVVEDDGPGFQVGADSHLGDGHLGLTGMQERAQLFGGRLQVTSAPGQGNGAPYSASSRRLPDQRGLPSASS